MLEGINYLYAKFNMNILKNKTKYGRDREN